MRVIAHISDPHFGRDDPAVTEALLADLNEQQPNLVIISGDLTQRARRSQYAAAAAFLARLTVPYLVVPGNHDIPLYDVVRRFFFPLNRYQQYISDNLNPFYHDPELAVLGITTARSFHWSWNGFWKDGRISVGQLQDIQLRLGKLPESIFKIIVTHHPFIPPPGQRLKGVVGGAGIALDMMELCGVDMLLAGHLHVGYSGDVRTYYAAAKRSILSIQAGTAVSTRRRSEPNAYNLIRIDRPAVQIDVRACANGHFGILTTTAYTRNGEVWQKATPQPR